VLVPLLSGGCTALEFGTNGSKTVIWGTVYTPLTTVLADGLGASVVEFRRGVVARGVGFINAPAGDTTGVFCLGSGSPCPGQIRVLTLTATVAGSVQARALIRLTDVPTLGAKLEILSWNMLRG
jgi:hypothetical protein